jgi:peptidoglycan biosynthesis protein MviN/MurJ (putative lipid II flippase)
LAMSLATAIEATLLFVVLGRRLGGADAGSLADFLLRTGAATGLMAGVVVAFLVGEDALDPLGAHTVWESLLEVAGGTMLGAATFFLTAFALRSPEALGFWRRLRLAI